MAGDGVTKTAESFGGERSTVSKVMIEFEKEGKTSSLKKKSLEESESCLIGTEGSQEYSPENYSRA